MVLHHFIQNRCYCINKTVSGVVRLMKLNEYLKGDKSGDFYIHVEEHKTENNQPALVILSEEQWYWLKLYEKCVRPLRYIKIIYMPCNSILF